MASAKELKAALRVAELEEKLAAAKQDGKRASTKLKDDVREARREYRTIREALEPAPEAVEASAAVEETN